MDCAPRFIGAVEKELKWFELFLHVRPVGEAARVRRVVLTERTPWLRD